MRERGSYFFMKKEIYMTFLQIEYFIEIVRSGSFTRAAEKLFVTHQALSLQIQAMEKELGMPLFDRSNRKKLALAESGEILYQAWVPLLESHRAAIREAKDHYEEQMKTLYIGVQDSPRIRELSIQVISEYIKRKNLKPEFIVGEPENLLSRLNAGELDMCSVISFALYGKEHLMKADIGGKKAVPVIVVSKEHPLSKKKKLTLWDIRDELIITFDDSFAKGSRIRIDEMLQRAGVSKYKLKVLKNVQEVKMAVCLNQGVAIELDMAMNDILDKVKLFSIDNLKEEDAAKIVMAWKDPKWSDIVSE